MRRFVFEDKEHEVKVTLDMSEEMFTLLKKSGQKKYDALRNLMIYTFDNGVVKDD